MIQKVIYLVHEYIAKYHSREQSCKDQLVFEKRQCLLGD